MCISGQGAKPQSSLRVIPEQIAPLLCCARTAEHSGHLACRSIFFVVQNLACCPSLWGGACCPMRWGTVQVEEEEPQDEEEDELSKQQREQHEDATMKVLPLHL